MTDDDVLHDMSHLDLGCVSPTWITYVYTIKIWQDVLGCEDFFFSTKHHQRTRQTDNNKQQKNRKQFQDYNTVSKHKNDTSITSSRWSFFLGLLYFTCVYMCRTYVSLGTCMRDLHVKILVHSIHEIFYLINFF